MEKELKDLHNRVTALEEKLKEQSPEEIAKRVEEIISNRLAPYAQVWGEPKNICTEMVNIYSKYTNASSE